MFAKILVKDGVATMKHLEEWSIDYSVDYLQMKMSISEKWNWNNEDAPIPKDISLMMPRMSEEMKHVYDIESFEETGEIRPSSWFDAELVNGGKNGYMKIIPMPDGNGTTFEKEEYGTRCFLSEDGKSHVETKTSFDD